ncbi:MAG: phosphoribosylformylglycinamidine synthase subunit PurQ, partial [Bacillota bacterium]
ATGGDYKTIRLSFQEYFESLGNDPKKWAKPFSTLLGALKVQDEFNLAAIGGKDSMSGTFNNISVPPTLISFALTTKDYKKIISPEFKQSENYIYILNSELDSNNIPNFKKLKKGFEKIYKYINKGKVKSAYSIDSGGISEAISKMAFGNKLGVKLNDNLKVNELFEKIYGSIIFETNKKIDTNEFDLIGKVIDKHQITYKNEIINLENVKEKYDKTLDNIFPRYKEAKGEAENIEFKKDKKEYCKYKIDKPKVFIPAFPGTNCEDDTLRAFEKAGAKGEIVVFNNTDKKHIKKSIDKMASVIKDSHIIAIPGGFSAGDEPDGSGKFIASVFRNEKIKKAVKYLLNEKDGLIIGICNGFQALIKLGLLPYGEIKSLDKDSPTLTFNKISRHVSNISNVKLSSNKSPWLQFSEFGKSYKTPMSHGEGRFYAKDKVVKSLIKNGQIATQYVDRSLNATMDSKYNPNGSIMAVEGITSRDGKIFGKMGHVERIYEDNLINIYNKNDMEIFKNGVRYFTHE